MRAMWYAIESQVLGGAIIAIIPIIKMNAIMIPIATRSCAEKLRGFEAANKHVGRLFCFNKIIMESSKKPVQVAASPTNVICLKTLSNSVVMVTTTPQMVALMINEKRQLCTVLFTVKNTKKKHRPGSPMRIIKRFPYLAYILIRYQANVDFPNIFIRRISNLRTGLIAQ